VLAQFEQDLVHLEGGRQRLDQHGRLDGPTLDPQRLLRETEDLVPKPRLEMRLELGQVQVRSRPRPQQPRRAVEEVQAEVKQRTGHRLGTDQQVALGQVPAAGTDHQRGGLRFKLVVAAVG
jgi:hypothetical protein